MVRIVFDNAARDADRISALDREVITDAACAAEMPFVIITSTARTPEEQARAMYANCKTFGPKKQLRLYGEWGDLVIRVYMDCEENGVTNEASVIEAMLQMINQIGPERVSHHCVKDWSKLHVIDISATRMPKESHARFEAAIGDDKRVVRYFSPRTAHTDPCFHVEIGQPS